MRILFKSTCFIFQRCGTWLVEAAKILTWEPENSIERRRGEGAKNELNALRNLLLHCEEQLEKGEEVTVENMANSDSLGDSFIEELL